MCDIWSYLWNILLFGIFPKSVNLNYYRLTNTYKNIMMTVMVPMKLLDIYSQYVNKPFMDRNII